MVTDIIQSGMDPSLATAASLSGMKLSGTEPERLDLSTKTEP